MQTDKNMNLLSSGLVRRNHNLEDIPAMYCAISTCDSEICNMLSSHRQWWRLVISKAELLTLNLFQDMQS